MRTPPSSTPLYLVLILVALGLHALWLHLRWIELSGAADGADVRRLAAAVGRLEAEVAELKARGLESSTAPAGAGGAKSPQEAPGDAVEEEAAKAPARNSRLDLPREVQDLWVEIDALRAWRLRSDGFFFVGVPGPLLGYLDVAHLVTVRSSSSNEGAPPWGAQQIAGEPDSRFGADQQTAWASLEQGRGAEWIVAEFEAPVAPQAIVIRETFNPGALVALLVSDGASAFHPVWEGDDPTETPGGNLVFFLDDGVGPVAQVRIELDTTRVGGWNEIDAIGLLVPGRIHWARTATASSSYADR